MSKNKLLEILKKAFPRPVLQKRYVVMLIIAFVTLFQIYLDFYEHPRIQRLLDNARFVGLLLLTDDYNMHNPDEEYS